MQLLDPHPEPADSHSCGLYRGLLTANGRFRENPFQAIAWFPTTASGSARHKVEDGPLLAHFSPPAHPNLAGA